jgi:hypothetical protein
MRLNVRDAIDLAHFYLRRYWAWMSSGSLLRFAIGYSAPIAALVLVFHVLINPADGLPSNFAVLEATAGPTAEVAGAAATAPASAQGTPAAPAATTTPAVSKGPLTYIVKSGDSLGAICSVQMPSMAIDACVSAIVQLNRLGGPDQLSVGQSLSLPAISGTSGNATLQAAPGSTANAGAAATSTPKASNSQSATAVKIASVSSPVKVGSNATLQVTAMPNASCSLQYNAPAGSKPATEGLVAKPTDSSGNVSWTWEINGNTKKGRGTVIVTCGGTTISSYIDVN